MKIGSMHGFQLIKKTIFCRWIINRLDCKQPSLIIFFWIQYFSVETFQFISESKNKRTFSDLFGFTETLISVKKYLKSRNWLSQGRHLLIVSLKTILRNKFCLCVEIIISGYKCVKTSNTQPETSKLWHCDTVPDKTSLLFEMFFF